MALIERQPMSPVAADAARVEPFASGTSIGRYRIISLAGSGAMGDVYRAHDRVLDRDVALKVLPPNLVHDRDRVRRFAQEARAASALSHPHIVTIYEVGHARPSLNVHPISGARSRRSEVHYIAMEFIDGKTLRETFDGAMPLAGRIELLIGVADGLTKAHAAGIIHRDLKPENIIVSNDGYAKIVDFGLAKLVDSDGWNNIGADTPTVALTHKGEILGTPGYMSPEQVTGGVIDQRSDIFSFGCILYEAISGRQPFEGESFLDTMHKIVHDDPMPLTEDVPPALAHVALKCLAKNRSGRYESIHDAKVELKQWLHGGAPRVDSNPPQIVPLKRKSPRGSLIAIAATTIIVGSALFAHHKFFGAASAREEHSIQRITSSGRIALATISPDGKYIAYVVSDEKNRYALWIEQIETHSRLQIAPPQEMHYTGISFSRDGNYLYFARYESYPFGSLSRVPILGGKPEIIVRDVDTRPTFSPDGKQLAFVRDDFNRALSTIYVTNSDGSSERALTSARIPLRFFAPAWSPDGKRIVAIEGTKLIEVAYPSGERHEITTQLHFQMYRGLTWTPDGSLIASAATEDAGDRVRLWRIDPSSGECRAMTDELSNVVAPSATADGSAVAALQIVRQGSLYSVDGSSNVRQLASGVGYYPNVAWAGNRVLYTASGDGNPDLWSVDIRGGEASRLTTEKTIDSAPQATRDGSRVIYRAGNGVQWSLWSMKPDGSERHQLTPGPEDGDFAISPDSKTLAWASLDRASNQWVLWTMPINGGPHQRLTSRKSVLDQIRFTPDGKSILFTGYEDTRTGIFKIATTGGEATLLTTKPSRDATPSPDGRSLACTYSFDQTSHASLGLVPLDDPAHVRTVDLKGGMYRWRDANDVSFIHDDNGAANLWLKPLGGDAAQKLTNFNEGSIVDYAWSDDGKRAVVAHVVDSIDVVVIHTR